jgi:MFS family permease
VSERDRVPYRETSIRWFILVINGFVCLGSYFANDTSAPLYDPLIDKLEISVVTYTNVFWSAYSYSGVFWPFFGGLLADRYGQDKLYLFNSIIVSIGVGIMTIGIYHLNHWVVLIGNVVFGFGSENLNISQDIYVYYWFHMKNFNLALNITMSLDRLGSVLD